MLGSISLAWKRLRYRRLASLLNMVSICLGSSLAIALLLLRGHGTSLLLHQPRGFDLLIGAKGSGVDLTLNTLYHIEQSPGTISWQLYRDLTTTAAWKPMVADAIPIASGDSVGGCDIIATIPQLFAGGEGEAAQHLACWDPGHPPTLSAGRMFRPGSIDAVIGSGVSDSTGLTIGSTFRPTHGTGEAVDPSDVHQRQFTVVGTLAPTGSIIDHTIVVSLEGFWSIDEHEEGLHAQAMMRNPQADDKPAAASTIDSTGMVHLGMPDGERRLSVILLRSRGPYWAQMVAYRLAAGDEASAVNPTAILAALLRHLLAPAEQVCAAMIVLLLVVAGLSILISCYQAVQAQARELAVLRALGATRSWILSMVVAEAALTGFCGALIGLIPGHLMIAILSHWMTMRLGQGIAWWIPESGDAVVILGVTLLSAMIGLLPGWLACRVQVAEQLC
jgi:putative ABC transport system permease protein